ncbi:MAG: recombination mediator RecR [Bacteroidota bacterium]
MIYASKLIEDAVKEISKLPGIGQKTALRLVLHLLKEEPQATQNLSESLIHLRTQIKYCRFCHFISDDDTCSICASHRREKQIICVVESSQDVMAIENTAQYQGLYHVLGGVISPMDGVSPQQLNIDTLLQRAATEEVQEVILALSPTMEGDTTAFYLTKKMKSPSLKISTIARGIPIGTEIEYADEITLGRSILSRTNYE